MKNKAFEDENPVIIIKDNNCECYTRCKCTIVKDLYKLRALAILCLRLRLAFEINCKINELLD